MSARALRILFVAFQAVWLNVIVPGHTRGIVTLGGGPSCESGGMAAHSCCPAKRDGPHPGSPTPAQQGWCAVCAFAARVTTPPTIDLRPPALELLCVAPVPAPAVAESARPRLAYDGRAPPSSIPA
jgi:hypothetical protein